MAVAKEPWKSDLQQTFARRVREEMEARQMSGNALAGLAKKMGRRLGQPTISRILEGKQDPSLERVSAVAEALGLPAWYLLSEASQAEERVIRPPALPQKVVRLSSPYPKLGQKGAKLDQTISKGLALRRKKRS